MALLRSEHLGRFDLNMLPYVTAIDFLAASAAITLGSSLYGAAIVLAASSILTTTALALFLNQRHLYPVDQTKSDALSKLSLPDIITRGLPPMLSGVGAQLLLMALAAALAGSRGETSLLLATTVGARILAGAYAVAILVWVVPVHVSSARNEYAQGHAGIAMTALFGLSATTVIAFGAFHGAVSPTLLIIAIGVGAIGAGLFLQSERNP